MPKIFGPVLTVTLFATAAAYAWHKGTNITLSNSVIPLFSVVVRVLALRTSSQLTWRLSLGGNDTGLQVRESCVGKAQMLTLQQDC